MFEFFCCGPGERQGKEKPVGRRHGARAKKNTTQGVFFFLRPRVKAGEGEAPARGQSKKKNTPSTGLLLPRPFPGAGAKKKHPGWCFVFCCGPARTLTHSLRAWVAMPPPRRGVFFFLLRPRPDRGGVCFFAVAPPGRSLTHCGLGRFRQGSGGVFFLLRPRRVFLDNNKQSLGYYIGSKKTRPGHSKKKHHFPLQTPERKNNLQTANPQH